MTSTETPSIDFGRNFGFAISEGPLTTVSPESGVEILPVTKVFFNDVGNSSGSTNVSVLTSVVRWSIGSVSALAVLMNILVMILIYKGQLLRKDHRLIYYVFMSVGEMCFATSTATNSLSVLISETNLFPVFGTCLMVQASAMGSFHMIGLSIVLLTHELYNHVASSLGNMSAKITGGVIKCAGCYTLGVLVCYLPFSFWADHPQELAICSIPAIYGKHIQAANYLGILTFCAIITLLLVANGVLLKAARSTNWRTKLRIHTDIPSSQIRSSVSSQGSSPAERTEPTTLPTTTDIQQTDTALKETRCTEKPVSGPSNELSMREDCSPRLSPTLALPHRPSSVSTETQATTLDEGSKDTKEIQPDLIVEDCKDILTKAAEEKENSNFQSALLEEPSVFTDVFETLDSFFVSGPSAECTTLESSRKKSRTLRESVVLSVMKLPAARENITQRNDAGKEEMIKVDTPASKGIRLSSRQGSSLTKSNGNSCCFSIIPCGGWTARTSPSGQGRSIEADSISSTESIKKRHLKNREMELRKFLKAVKTEITFALAYVFCTLPSLVWNIKSLYCPAPCSSEETAFMDFYYVGMAILPFINPIILFFTLK